MTDQFPPNLASSSSNIQEGFMVLLSAHQVQNDMITSTIMGEQNPEKLTMLVIQKENCRESHSSNTFEDLNLVVFVDMQDMQDMQFLGMLLYWNSTAHNLKFSLLVRLTLAPWWISFLTIPTFPILAAIMRAVSWDS